MNQQEFERYLDGDDEPVIRAADFVGSEGDRVLCEGYDVDTYADVTVSLRHGMLVLERDGEGEFVAREFPARRLRPTKRAHPGATDYDFAVAMRQAGEPLTFARWTGR